MVTIASMLPPLTPWLMFERLVLAAVPWWQLVIAIVAGLAAIAGIVRWAAAIYKRNLLRDGGFSLAAVFGRAR